MRPHMCLLITYYIWAGTTLYLFIGESVHHRDMDRLDIVQLCVVQIPGGQCRRSELAEAVARICAAKVVASE